MMQGEEVSAGDFVMVHVGYAIQRVSEQDAQSAWDLFDQVLAYDGAAIGGGRSDV